MGMHMIELGGSAVGKVAEEFWKEVIKPAIKEVQPELIASGKTLTKQLGAQYGKQLHAKGRSVAEDIVWKAMGSLPPYVRSYVSPQYVEKPSKIPAWVGEMVEPLVGPVIAGAKEVAAEKAEKMKAPLYTLLVGLGVGVFFVGYAIGKKL